MADGDGWGGDYNTKWSGDDANWQYNRDKPKKSKGQKSEQEKILAANPDLSSNLKGFLTGKKRKGVIAALVCTFAVLLFGLLIHTLSASLLLKNLHAHISERRMTRSVRTLDNNSALLTAEKVTTAASGDAALLSRSPLGRAVNAWNPERGLRNMKSNGAFSVEYEGRRIARIWFDGDPVAVEAPQLKNFWNVRRNNAEWRSFYQQLYQKTDHALLRDGQGFIVRSRISKEIIRAFGGHLWWWQRKGIEEKGKEPAQALQDEQQRIFENDEKPSTGAVTAKDSGLDKAKETALEQEKACLANAACAKRVSSGSATLLEASGADKTIASFAKRVVNPPGFTGLLARFNWIIQLAVPICIIHDGTMTAVNDYLRAQNAAAMAAWVGLSSQVSQQFRGDVTGEAIGGAIGVLGNISNSIPEMWARGEATDTTTEPFAQSARYQNYSILSHVFDYNLILLKAVNVVVSQICPILLDPRLILGLLAVQIVAGIIQAFSAPVSQTAEEAAAAAAQRTVTTVVRRALERIITKYNLKDPIKRKALRNGALKFGLFNGAVIGGTELLESAVRMMVLSEIGSFVDGSNVNDGSNKDPAISEAAAPYVNQMDMGAVSYNNEMDRQQNFGRPMTDSETLATQETDKAFVVAQQNQRSFIQRHFALSDPNSTLAHSIMNTDNVIQHPSAIWRFFGRLPRMIGSIFSHSKAVKAASQPQTPTVDNTNYNIVQWGWTNDEIDKINNDPSFEPLKNAAIVAPISKQIADKYGPCYALPSDQLQEVGFYDHHSKYLSRDETTGQVDENGLCSPYKLSMNNPEFGPMMVFRWRYDCSLQSAMVELRDIERADGTTSAPVDCGVTAPTAGPAQSTNPVAPPLASATAPSQPSVATISGDASTPCDPNTRDVGVHTGYQNGSPVQIRLCSVPNLPCHNEECDGGYGITGGDGHALVNSTISRNIYEMVAAAQADGVSLTANSTFRTIEHQQSLCPCDGVNKARPGYSNHQMGYAIDFGGLPSSPGPVPGNRIWEWLSANANRFGMYNYPHEAWHWSPTGH